MRGSGTRVIAGHCKCGGYYGGSHLNRSQDAMYLIPFYNRWTKKYLEMKHIDFYEDMRSQLQTAIKLHSEENEKFFVKNPRSLLMLPFLHSVYPDMKFIHIVCDGRAMAFSSNRRHVKHYSDLFLNNVRSEFLNKMSSGWSPEKAINFWANTNIMAFEYGTQHMGENYLLIKYEPLCTRHQETYETLVDFIGCSHDLIPEMMRKAKITDTFKRGKKNKPKEEVDRLEAIAGHKTFQILGYGAPYYKRK